MPGRNDPAGAEQIEREGGNAMEKRKLGRIGVDVSEIGIGTWALGADWGAVDDRDSVAALHAALDSGMTFIDTADVYGDGRSERLIAGVLKERGGPPPFVATKLGRRLPAQDVAGYTLANMKGWVERSLRNLAVDALDLVQLHCPPTALYYEPQVFEDLDRLVADGKIKHYGVSVEKVEEALKAIEFPNVATVQIICNIFRQRPIDLFFNLAKQRGVAIFARVPRARTGTSTDTAKRSMSGKPSPACPTRRALRRWKNCVPWFPQATPWRSSRFAGFSNTTRSRSSSRARRTSSSRRRTRPRRACRRWRRKR